MKRTWKGAGMAAVGVLALAGGIVAAGGLPAAADGAPFNAAFTAAASGVISHRPIAEAEFPGDSPVGQPFAVIPGLLTTGGTENQAGPDSALSVVTRVAATRLGHMDLTATAVASTCRLDAGGGPMQPASVPDVRNRPRREVTADTIIITGKIAGAAGPIMLPVRPAPNTRIAVPGGIVLTLNRQFTVDGGTTLIVEAMHASLRGGAETLDIGVSACNDMDLSPSPSPSPS
jgi:hypothetical protein